MVRRCWGEADFFCSLGSPISGCAASCGRSAGLGGEGRQGTPGRGQPHPCHWQLFKARWIKTCDSGPMPSTTGRRMSHVAWELRGCAQLLTMFEPPFITRANIQRAHYVLGTVLIITFNPHQKAVIAVGIKPSLFLLWELRPREVPDLPRATQLKMEKLGLEPGRASSAASSLNLFPPVLSKRRKGLF